MNKRLIIEEQLYNFKNLTIVNKEMLLFSKNARDVELVISEVRVLKKVWALKENRKLPDV